MSVRTIIIDNYDSFTFNLYQAVAALTDEKPIVLRNDEVSWNDLRSTNPDCVIISPGPGRPDRDSDFGLSARIIDELDVPILGVCLGHQGICHLAGGRVVHAPEPMHGRIDNVYHDGSGVFRGLPNPFRAVRYHSLICAAPPPPALERTAWTADDLIMGVAHREKPIWGVQFHPESICTESGNLLLKNFLDLAAESRGVKIGRRTDAHLALGRNRASKPSPSRKLFVHKGAAPADSAHVFQTLFGSEDVAVWLDSALEHPETARFSIMAGGSLASTERIAYDASSRVISIQRGGETEFEQGDLFAYLKRRIAEAEIEEPALPFQFSGGFIGYFGYEMKNACGSAAVHRASTPDSSFFLADRSAVIDHATGELYLLFAGARGQDEAANRWFDSAIDKLTAPKPVKTLRSRHAIEFHPSRKHAEYLENIGSCLDYIRDGESYEICLTNQLKAATNADPLSYYQNLRRLNPAPHAAFLRFPEVSVACSSPERFLRVSKTGAVETKPIKGTIRRCKGAEEDRVLRDQLQNDVKSRAENLMIVDLLRNDLGRVCEVGTVTVPKLMDVESYATVHQLVSTIAGQLEPDQAAADCIRAAFPGGSMTGAPKIRTMEIIDKLEGEARGIYSGSIGYLSFNGSADFNIVIRTAVFQDGQVSIGVGGAIIALSDPEEEWQEILLKAAAPMRAFGAYTLAADRPVGVLS